MKKIIITALVCIITLVLLWLYFYHSYSKNVIYAHLICETRPIEDLKKLVIEKNDKTAFSELDVAYSREEYPDEYFFYALLMANKCHNGRAYFHVYYQLKIYEYYLEKDIYDKETKAFMLDYLKKGAALGDRLSYNELGELYMEGKYVPKDTLLGKKLIKKAGY